MDRDRLGRDESDRDIEDQPPTVGADLLYLLFFASGIASLVYEVCWVRAFGNQLGNTVHSAALVTAVFMCGLGAGSWFAGGWADRRRMRSGSARALMSAYGGCELGAAAIGLALVWVLPRLGGVAGGASYVVSSEGWHEVALATEVRRYAIAIVLVAPPTFLMGATLTLLVRAIVTADITQAGSRIGLLYGANTAGAALGALACDAWLVPAVGIMRTQMFAVGLQAGVGLVALVLAWRSRDAEAAITGIAKEPKPRPGSPRIVNAACAALALSGFAAMGMEIAWFRFLSASLGGFRFVFSLVLALVLAGIWGGAFAGAKLARRFEKRPLELFIGSQAVVVVSALGLLATHRSGSGTPYFVALQSALWVVGLPSFAMGFAFPLVNAHVQDTMAVVGRRAGYMYLANTIGSVAGSVAAGFVLLPRVGAQVSFALFALCAMTAALPLWLAANARGRVTKKVFAAATVASLVAIVGWLALPGDWVTRRFWRALPPSDRVLAFKEGPNETVAVVVDPPGRMLMTNGHSMSSTTPASQRYMRAFAHVPLLLSDRRERALVICFGVGSTLHATSLHPVSRIELADLSRNVLERAGYFRQNNHDVLGDPRVSVFIEDGRAHLRAQPEGTYDLVTLEPPPLGFAGVSALYSREFYELARTRLAPNGWMTQWLPIYDMTPDVALSMVRAFVDVFPASVLLSGFSSELILVGTRSNELVLDIDRIEERLREQPRVAEDLHGVRLDTLTGIAGMFVADAEHMRRVTSGVAPLTDDRPSMEYTFAQRTSSPPALFERAGDRDSLRRFCPKCFVGDEPDPRVAMLPKHIATLARVYASNAFLTGTRRPFPIDREGLEEVIAGDEYLQALVGAPPQPRRDGRDRRRPGH